MGREDVRGRPLMAMSVATSRELEGWEVRFVADAWYSEYALRIRGWDEDVLATAPALRWVHFLWAGIESQLFPAALESGVVITNTAGGYAEPMADHVMALVLALARRLDVCMRRPPERVWPGGPALLIRLERYTRTCFWLILGISSGIGFQPMRSRGARWSSTI